MKYLLAAGMLLVASSAYAACTAVPGSALWTCPTPPVPTQCKQMVDAKGDTVMICNAPVPDQPVPVPGNCSWGKKGYVCK